MWLIVSGDSFYIEPDEDWFVRIPWKLCGSQCATKLRKLGKVFLRLMAKRQDSSKERPIGGNYILARRTASDNVPRIEQITSEAVLRLSETYMTGFGGNRR